MIFLSIKRFLGTKLAVLGNFKFWKTHQVTPRENPIIQSLVKHYRQSPPLSKAVEDNFGTMEMGSPPPPPSSSNNANIL